MFMTALASALSLLSFGCGGTNHLQSILLTPTANVLEGIGGTVQITAKGHYSTGADLPISDKVKWTVVADGTALGGGALPAPPQTVQFNTTGLITAVDPAACSFDFTTPVPPAIPAPFLTGSYKVTATLDGVTSQPVYLGVASFAHGHGPTGGCDK
jgi:hypothetical protein